MRRFLVVLAAGVGMAALGGARVEAQIGPYAMFSAGHYSGLGVGNGTAANQSGGMTALGGTFGVYDDVARAGPISVGGDARLIVENSANSTPAGNKITGFLVGGRVDGNPVVLPFRPYAQVEIGVVGTNNGTGSTEASSFAYQFQFGGDFTLLPHLGLRVEYGAGQLSTGGGTNHTLQTFSSGLVLRL
jgi:hypothetical protein